MNTIAKLVRSQAIEANITAKLGRVEITAQTQDGRVQITVQTRSGSEESPTEASQAAVDAAVDQDTGR